MSLFFQEPKPYWISGIEEDETPPGWDPVPNPWNYKGKKILSYIVVLSIYARNTFVLSFFCT
jgi:hypothetical protein